MSPSQTEEVGKRNIKMFAWTQVNVLLKKRKHDVLSWQMSKLGLITKTLILLLIKIVKNEDLHSV